MILKFTEFLFEARGKNKEELVNLLFKFLEQKPKVERTGNYPSEKGAYCRASVKQYFRENGFTSDDADSAFYYIANDKTKKEKLKSFSAKNYHYDENVPYYYTDLTESEAQKIKAKLEEDSKEMSKGETEKREAVKKKAPEKKTTKTTERKTPAKKTTTRKTK
jgi:hypothetical protein